MRLKRQLAAMLGAGLMTLTLVGCSEEGSSPGIGDETTSTPTAPPTDDPNTDEDGSGGNNEEDEGGEDDAENENERG
jgi:hypothetical protein